MEGWVKLHRKLLDWQWFKVPDMVQLFIYLLLKANHDADEWRGIKVIRGQLITGLNSLNSGTGISIQTLRTCLKRLEKSGEINMQSTNKYTIITICNYESYQTDQQTKNGKTNKQLTNNQQTTNKQLTTNKNIKNEENLNNENNKEVLFAEFENFWNLYGKKVGNKLKAFNKWQKLTDETKSKIFQTLPAFLNSISNKQYIPYPETYLNDQRWNDEIQVYTQTQNNSPPQSTNKAQQVLDANKRVHENFLKKLENGDFRNTQMSGEGDAGRLLGS